MNLFDLISSLFSLTFSFYFSISLLFHPVSHSLSSFPFFLLACFIPSPSPLPVKHPLLPSPPTLLSVRAQPCWQPYRLKRLPTPGI